MLSGILALLCIILAMSTPKYQVICYITSPPNKREAENSMFLIKIYCSAHSLDIASIVIIQVQEQSQLLKNESDKEMKLMGCQLRA